MNNNDVPMVEYCHPKEGTPTYYCNQRPYYGMWWNCYDQSINTIPEFVALVEKAQTGEIKAMLDLAVGFLPLDVRRNGVGLICMPAFTQILTDGTNQVYCAKNDYDARYYYCVVSVCEACARMDLEQLLKEPIPKDYVCNALLETIKFYLYINAKVDKYVSGIVENKDGEQFVLLADQFQVANSLFNSEKIYHLGNVRVFVHLLLCLADHLSTLKDILSEHRENTRERICYLAYCIFCIMASQYPQEVDSWSVDEGMALSPEDVGKPVTLGTLWKYVGDDVNKDHYAFTCAVLQAGDTEKVVGEKQVAEMDHSQKTQTGASDYEKKFPSVYRLYRDAQEMIAMHKADLSLMASRKALEELMRELCKKICIPVVDGGRDVDLISMIGALEKEGFFDDKEVQNLHRIRELGNKGVHNDGTMAQAQEAVTLLGKMLENMDKWADDERIERIAQGNNVPMSDPDYYSSKRRYYGMWSNCYSREDLEVIPEYVALSRKANAGDITAMLDLAVGFLPKKIVWSNNHLVCMPKYVERGEEFYQENAYDARYYYWILKASYAGMYAEQIHQEYPLKYMATAYLETAKFILYTRENVALYVSGREKTLGDNNKYRLLYKDQYKLAEEMFGKNIFSCISSVDEFYLSALYALQLADTYDDPSVIATVHRENTLQRLRYLVYCGHYYATQLAPERMSNFVISEHLLIDAEDGCGVLTEEIMEKYTYDPVCKKHYDQTRCIVQEMLRKQERERKKNARPIYLKAIENTPPKNPSDRDILSESMRFLLAIFTFLGTFCLLCYSQPVDATLIVSCFVMAGTFYGWQQLNKIKLDLFEKISIGNLICIVIKLGLAVEIGWIFFIVKLCKVIRAIVSSGRNNTGKPKK